MSEHDHFQIDETTWGLMMDKLNDIHSEVKRTNGRVSVLEQWKSYIQGALALTGLLVVPALVWVVYQVVTKVH